MWEACRAISGSPEADDQHKFFINALEDIWKSLIVRHPEFSSAVRGVVVGVKG